MVEEKDITERKKIEEALRQSEEKYRALTEASGDAICVLDRNGCHLYSNPACSEFFGKEPADLIGRELADLIPKEKAEEILEDIQCVFQEKGVIRREHAIQDGKNLRQFSMTLAPMLDDKRNVVSVVVTARDITETKRLQEKGKEVAVAKARAKTLEKAKKTLQKRVRERTRKLEKAYQELAESQDRLLRTEKLATVGRLGAGVAHELNNPLGIIFMNIQRLAQKMAEERANLPADKAGMIGWESYQRAIERIKKASLRSQRIINSLLSFSRISEPKFSSTNINRVLDEIFSLVEHQVSLENIKIIKKYDPHLPKVLGDPSQLKQVFINLILNAQQAMLQGGKLYITTKKKRNSIEAEVRDTGCGIPKKDIGKIFDPFFSSSKKGTGLGLFVSHGIIEHHHGSIEIKSEKGKGTSVIVHLPR